MAGGINLTGLPDTGDYNLGRGKVSFAPIIAATGLPGEFRDLGNAPEFSMTVETETLEHTSSRGGLKVVDKEVVISLKASISLILDEINFQNLAIFMAGTSGTISNNDVVVGIAASVSTLLTTIANPVKKGYWYDLRKTDGTRMYDIDPTKLTVSKNDTDDAVTITALTQGTDYTVDAKMGRIFIPSTSSIVPASTPVILFALAGDAGAAATVDQTVGLTQTTIRGVLKFIAENPANGDKQTEHQFNAISLKADGDFSLIGDEYSQMGFTGVAEKNELGFPNYPTYFARTHAQA